MSSRSPARSLLVLAVFGKRLKNPFVLGLIGAGALAVAALVTLKRENPGPLPKDASPVARTPDEVPAPEPPLRIERMEIPAPLPLATAGKNLPPARPLRPLPTPGAPRPGRPAPATPASLDTPWRESILLSREDVLKERSGTFGYNSRRYGATLAPDRVEMAIAGDPLKTDRPFISYRLEEVRAGDTVLAAGGALAPQAVDGERAVRYERGKVEERYVLGRETLEQLFIVRELPANRGEIVVKGALTTNTTPPAEGTRGKTLEFVHGGKPALSLSEAVAFDAAGNRLPLELAYSGGKVSITVPADWVAGAVLPITIDPLIGGPLIVDPSATNIVPLGKVAYTSMNEWLVVWDEQFGATAVTEIFAQRVGASGTLTGTPIGVSVGGSTVLRFFPSISRIPDTLGRFLVVWSHYDPTDTAFHGQVVGRLMNPNGSFATGPFAVLPFGLPEATPGSAYTTVAGVGSSWLVAATVTGPPVNNVHQRDIGACVVASSGALGVPFKLDSDLDESDFPEIDSSNGSYVAIWKKFNASTNIGSLVGRAVASNGTFLSATGVIDSGVGPGGIHVSGDSFGKFLVTWPMWEFDSSVNLKALIVDSSLNLGAATSFNFGPVVPNPTWGFFTTAAYSLSDLEWLMIHSDPNDQGELYARRVRPDGTHVAPFRVTRSADRETFARAAWNSTTNEILAVYAYGQQSPFALRAQRVSTGEPRAEALFVVGNTNLALAASAGDLAVSNRLQRLGYAVRLKSDGASASTDAAGKALVVISSTVTSGSVNTKFRTVSVPVINWENALYNYNYLGMTGMTSGTHFGTQTGQTLVSIVDSAHPLAAGRSGNVTVATSAQTFTWGVPSAAAATVATIATIPGRAVIFGYEKGAAMPGLVAPARRVGFYLDNTTFAAATPDALALFDAAVTWAAGGAPGSPAAPAGLVATGAAGFVDLDWAASAGATGYTVKRSTIPGGPYDDVIATNVAVTDFRDFSASPGTTYYYVVTALAGAAESAPSNEAAGTPGGTLGTVLFVAGSTVLSFEDALVEQRLRGLGYSVVVKGDTASATSDATGKALVVISSTILSTNVENKFRGVTVPVLNWENRLFDNLGMTGTSVDNDFNKTAGESAIAIADPGHPLAAGLSGTVTATATPATYTWGIPGTSAAKVGTLATDPTMSKTVLFAYDTGVSMPGLAAPARRVGFFFEDVTVSLLTPQGWKLFDAAVFWAAGRVPSGPPPPTGLTATPGDQSVLLQWTEAPGATSYVVKRSLASGGSYSDVQTVTVASFNDVGLRNGTTYYYVVTAKKDGLESVPSNEAFATPRANSGDSIGQVLLVSEFATEAALGAGDKGVYDRLLALGFSVVIKAHGDAVTADATGKTLVLISSTVASDTVGDKFKSVAVPVMHWENKLHDNQGMTGPVEGDDYGISTGQSVITVLNTTHPLAAGLSGTIAVTGGASTFTWGVPIPTAATVASLSGDSSKAVIFAYETGTLMNGLTAPARRVGFFLENTTAAGLNANGKRLFDTAVRWAAALPNGAPPTPTGLSALPVDKAISLSWSGSGVTYNVKRAERSGGPYATIFNVGTTVYTDTPLVNGRTYYYVVSALAQDGSESANSTEVLATPGTGPVQTVLLVTKNNPPQAGDVGVKKRLEDLGYAVEVRTAWNVPPLDTPTLADPNLPPPSAGKALIVVSSTVDSGTVGDLFRDVAVPVLNWENALHDNLALVPSVAGAYGTTSGQNSLTLDPTHPLSAGLGGTVPVLASGTLPFSWGQPGPGFSEVAGTQLDGKPAIFAYEAGADMAGGIAAPARRVGFFMGDDTWNSLNGFGRALFDAAVRWLINASPPGAPSNLAATANNGKVQLSWTAGAGAFCYTVFRSAAAVGPFNVVANGVLSTAYEDDTVTSGIYYYYVVAVNAAGESGPSNQVRITVFPAGEVPDPPANLRATAYSTCIDLEWDPPASPVTGYNVYRRIAGETAWTSLNPLLIVTPRFRDEPGDLTKTYEYHVTSVRN